MDKKRPLITSDISSRIRKFDSYTPRANSARLATQRGPQVLDLRPKAPPKAKPLATQPKTKPAQQDFVVRPKVQQQPKPKIEAQPIEQSEPHKLELPHKAVEESTYQPASDLPIDLQLPEPDVSNRGNLFLKLFYGFGVVVFAATMAISAQTFVFNRQAREQVDVLGAQELVTYDEQGVSQGAGDEPSSEEPSETSFFNYQVAPDKPRYLRVPSLSSFSRIKQLGNTPEGAVDAPWNIHDAGWYETSAVPGSSTGVSLLLGHRSNWSDPGVFKDLDSLIPGEIVEVEMGNGDVVRYSVDRVDELPVEQIDMAEVLYEVPTGEHSLRLMTCSGTFDANSEEYGSRTIVYASPL